VKTDAALAAIRQEYALDEKLGDPANMSGDAQLMGNILLDAGRTDEAATQFRRALDVVEKSTLSDEVKQDTRLAGRYNTARVALAKWDLTKAKTEAQAYEQGATARKNAFRIRQAHQILGGIAMAEKEYDAALAHYAEANQQDPQVLYLTALVHQAKGDGAKAKEFAARAANAHILPQITYAFVRAKAKKLA
jgi:tetratricopeptide (TPR) repeat protein